LLGIIWAIVGILAPKAGRNREKSEKAEKKTHPKRKTLPEVRGETERTEA